MQKLFFTGLLLGGMLVSCGEKTAESTGTPQENSEAPAAEVSDQEKAAMGEVTFKAQCVLCHGSDGKLGASGAKDLTTSTLNHQDAFNVISYGRGGMMAYKDLLTKDQIEQLVCYIETLRKK